MAPSIGSSEPSSSGKRKERSDDQEQPSALDEWAGFETLDMVSDDEHASDSENEDGSEEEEPFPEIDVVDDDEESEQSGASESENTSEDDDPQDELGSESENAPSSEGAHDAKGNKERDFEEDPASYPKPTVITSDITGEPKKVYPPIEPEYDSDSSTEDQPNRVGRVPMHWYDDLPHIGYDINGKKILKPAKGDELDKFLATVEDPASWMSGFDHSMQKDTELTGEELDIIRRLQEAENPDATYDPYEDQVEWFTGKGKERIMPLTARPEPKSRWQPSKWERQKVLKIVRLIRAGRIIPQKPKSKEKQWYYLWANQDEDDAKRPPPLTAPKVPLPKHAESYNPPEEYLPDEEEKEAYEQLEEEAKLRRYLPKKYDSLRHVPLYENFIKERQNRLLDLYLAPRIQRTRVHINPDSLLPSLPSPQDLKPFPVFEAMKMSGGGTSRQRCLSVSPDGVWTVAGGEDGVVRVWETFVGREAARWKLGKKVGAIEWCPRKDVSFFMVGVEDEVYAFMPPYLPSEIEAATLDALMPRNLPPPPPTSDEKARVKWTQESATFKQSTTTYSSPLVVVGLPPGAGLPKQITFHRRGDYFATVSGREGHSIVWIHQISKRHSQSPFRKTKGFVQKVLFHPTKPHFFVATQRLVTIYDLSAQKVVKTLRTGCRWISSMDVHPTGDHLIVGGYDKKLMWFDLELGIRPYKILRYHARAIRSVAFSTTYPLFASSSDDGTIQIFHARVFSDLMSDPLIVPLKVLRGHEVKDGLGVLEVKWAAGLGTCWLVSAGADGEVRVWCN